jgi:D-3-phosphoglycerate dehydrogenase
MDVGVDLQNFNIVRLNADISPVYDEELGIYARYGLNPIQAEANTPAELVKVLAGCDGLLVVSSALPKEVIESLKRCRVISRLGIGTDKIDCQAAAQAGIIVTNVPGAFAEEMADHTLAFILALARKFPLMSAALQRGDWSGSRRLSIQNQRLSQCTLGLVGFGDSAKRVAQRARAFGMRLIATRRQMDQTDPVLQTLGVTLVDLDSLLAQADFVSLHLPLNVDTFHLFDKGKLQKMKPGAYLINTARGAIVDEYALAEALSAGRLGGAGLDTFENINPFCGVDGRQESALLYLENVILTPHVAALSEQGLREVTEQGVANLAAVLQGVWPPPQNIVNSGVQPRYKLSTVNS